MESSPKENRRRYWTEETACGLDRGRSSVEPFGALFDPEELRRWLRAAGVGGAGQKGGLRVRVGYGDALGGPTGPGHLQRWGAAATQYCSR